MEMKTTERLPVPEDSDNPGCRMFWTIVEDFMILAHNAEHAGNVSVSALIYELDRVSALHFVRILEYQTSPEYTWHSRYVDYLSEIYGILQSPTPTHDDLLSFMVHHGLQYSVVNLLSTHPQAVLTKKGRPLLYYVCLRGQARFSLRLHPIMIRLLIEGSADPNQVFNGRSAWQSALNSCVDFFLCSDDEGPSVSFSALTVLVKHGANPNACIDVV
jgi:hypothetical protein